MTIQQRGGKLVELPYEVKAIPGHAEYEAIEVLLEIQAKLNEYSDRFWGRGIAWMPINRKIGKARALIARAIRDLHKQRDEAVK